MTTLEDDGVARARVGRHVGVAFVIGILIQGMWGCGLRGDVSTKILGARPIAGGFASPVELVGAPDGSGRLFVVDQVGLIWIILNGKPLEKPFLDIHDRLVQLLPFYDERGLLGLAFHPAFATNGRFYVYYSAPLQPGRPPDKWDHTTRVSEFTVSADDPNQADPSSERIVMSIDKPGYNFEGGGLAFGPDGLLYIGTGDSVHDPSSEAGRFGQDTYSLLGKILRIDVNVDATDVSGSPGAEDYHIPPGNPFIHTGGRPEIFAYGFRNPYRISFDPAPVGLQVRLFVGDVGQAMMEEIDLVVAGGNYGWPIREGTTCFNANDWSRPLPRCAVAGLVDPLLAYPHAGKASAIVGGDIYRGSALPGLYGDFVFGDWGRGPQNLFAAYPSPSGSVPWKMQQVHIELPDAQGAQLLGIGMDQDHELYLLTKDPGVGPVGNTGRVYLILPP